MTVGTDLTPLNKTCFTISKWLRLDILQHLALSFIPSNNGLQKQFFENIGLELDEKMIDHILVSLEGKQK
jgi:hypothetical protein